MLIKRLGAVVVILLVLTAVLFGLQKASPSDPVHTMLGPGASQSAIAAEKHVLHLDEPVPQQYFRYVGGLFKGDLGTSYRTRRSVSTDIGTFLPATLELTLFSLVLALMLAALLAVATTLNWPGAGLFKAVLLLGASAPSFLLAIGGIILFYKHLGWLPALGRSDYPSAPTGPTGLLTVDSLVHGRIDIFFNALQHLLLPGLAIALGPAVSIGRVLRSSLVTTLRTDYTRTARAKGFTEPVRHAPARAAQLARPGPVDDRPPGGPDVRRGARHRGDLRVARVRASTPRRASRSTTSPPSPASPCCWARATS